MGFGPPTCPNNTRPNPENDYVEMSYSAVATISFIINCVTLITVRGLRASRKTLFLLCLQLLILTEILLCSMRLLKLILHLLPKLDLIEKSSVWLSWLVLVRTVTGKALQLNRNWWLVSITGLRLYRLVAPLKSRTLLDACAIKRLFAVVIILSALPSLILLPFFGTCLLNDHRVTIRVTARNQGQMLLLLALSHAAPTLFLLCLSAALIVRLSSGRRRRHPSGSSSGGDQPSPILRRNSENDRISGLATRTVLLIAACFLVYQLPFIITFFVYRAHLGSKFLGIVMYITVDLVYVDTLSNCAVLLASSAAFRRAFLERLRCRPVTSATAEAYRDSASALLVNSRRVSKVLSDTALMRLQRECSSELAEKNSVRFEKTRESGLLDNK